MKDRSRRSHTARTRNSNRKSTRRSSPYCLLLECLEDRKLLSINISDPMYWGDIVDNPTYDAGPLNDGILTINGDLTFSDDGSIHANDDRFKSTDPLLVPNASAFPITIVVSGDVIMGAGTSLVAENRTAGGNGGNISLTVGQNFIMQDGAVVSSSKTAGSGDTGHSGDITIHVDGDVTVGVNAEIAAGRDTSNRGPAGAIEVTATNITVDGSVLSVSGMTGVGINQPPGGGTIFLVATDTLTVGDTGVVSSRGLDPGADLVHLEACEVFVYGLVESTGSGHAIPTNPPNHLDGDFRPDKPENSTGGVEIWAGTLVIDSTGTHKGEVKADIGITGGPQGVGWIDLFARGDIFIRGNSNASVPFSVHANGGLQQNTDDGGLVTVKSTEGQIFASGRALQADATSSGSDGGVIVVEAFGNVDLNTASIFARGDFNTTGGYGDGGHLTVRSYNGSISWQNGVGDVRPTGDDPPPPPTLLVSGTISLIYNTSIDTTNTSFPTGGVNPLPPNLPFPLIVQNSTGGAPTLPDYVILPICIDDLCVICSGETFVFGSTPEWGTVTYVTFDFNPVAKGGVPAILTDGNQAFKNALASVTTFVYDPLDVQAVQNQKGVNLWYVQIDVGADAILVKDGVTVQTQRYYGKAGKATSDDPTPGMILQTTCHVTVEGDQDLSNGNQGGGKIIVQSHNDLAGDLTIEARGDIVIDGTVGNGVSGTLGKPGTINLLSLCSDIHVGPTGRVEVIGQDPGGGRINIVTGEILSECGCNKGVGGDIIIEGLVQAHSKAPSEATMPTINIVAFDGKVKIDGNNQFGLEAGTQTTVTSGVHVYNRLNPVGGIINIQAAQDVEVVGNTILNAVHPNRGAISGNKKATNARGNAGDLEIVSVYGSIKLTDRAIDFENRFNQLGKITLLAAKDIAISVTAAMNAGAANNAKVVVDARGGASGTGGTICMHAGANINVGAMSKVLATASGGTNGKVYATADDTFANDGEVSPLSGPCNETIDAIFENLGEVLF